jgi:hypothetical protein
MLFKRVDQYVDQGHDNLRTVSRLFHQVMRAEGFAFPVGQADLIDICVELVAPIVRALFLATPTGVLLLRVRKIDGYKIKHEFLSF